MKRKRSSSAQMPAHNGPAVDTFYRISEHTLLTAVKGHLDSSTIEEIIKQMRSELEKFSGDVRPMFWALDALDITAFDALGIQESSRRLAAVVKESIGNHVVLIHAERDGSSASPFIMFMRGLMFGAQLRLHAIRSKDELGPTLEQIRKQGDAS